MVRFVMVRPPGKKSAIRRMHGWILRHNPTFEYDRDHAR